LILYKILTNQNARVAELADALDLGSSSGDRVGVQISPLAPVKNPRKVPELLTPKPSVSNFEALGLGVNLEALIYCLNFARVGGFHMKASGSPFG
jgi:hypothetical protein